MDFVAPRRAAVGSRWHAIALLGAVLAPSGLFAGNAVQDSPPPLLEPPSSQEEPTNPDSLDALTQVVVPPLTLQQEVGLSREVRPFLAQAFARAARRLFVRAEPELIHVSRAFDFATLAVEIDEGEVECWRLLLAVSGAANPDDPEVRAAEAEALKQISRMDPEDSVIRLRRLLWAIEQTDTVEARLTRFEHLLSPESIELIGTEVAARLALDMAQLLFRSGDTDGFARRLAQSLELDPSCPSATAMAAGYFASDDPVDESELLVAALVADPLETGFVAELGTLALENGAYKGAERMVNLARTTADASGQDSNTLGVRHALALWGLGRGAAALGILEDRMRNLDAAVRERMQAANPGLSPTELVQTHAAFPPTMALLKAAILSEEDDKKAYREFVGLALRDLALLLRGDASSTTEDLSAVPTVQEAVDAELLLKAAAFAAWQGEDAEVMARFVKAAQEQVELSPEALSRFEAWGVIAQGRTELAIAMLTQLEEEDELAALALSIAYERSGRSAEAAKIWFRLARASPGTIIGIWARNRLEGAIGASIPESEAAKEIDLVIQEVPSSVDRLLLERDRAYALRFEPVSAQIGPFEPIRYTLELANRSGLPLAIGPDGPILPTMAIIPTITIAGTTGSNRTDWVIIQIDRQLVIEPRGSLSMILNLNYYPVSEISVARAGVGLTLDARAITNFMSDGRMIGPDRFGEKVTARLLRLDGITPDAPYRRDALAAALVMKDVKGLNALVSLLQLAVRSGGKDADEASITFKNAIFNLYLDQYAQLPAAPRAWLAYTAPMRADVPGYDRIVEAIQSDRSALVMNTLLAKLTWGGREGADANEYLVRLAESENSEVASAARELQDIWKIALEEERATSGAER